LVSAIGLKSVNFQSDNHFFSIEDTVYQLLLPPIVKEGALYLPVHNFIEVVGNKLPGNLSFRNGELEYLPPVEKDNSLTVKSNIESDRGKWHFDTIVIDAGHGGKDPGAIGPTRFKEKSATLDIALRLEQLLKTKTKLKVVLTRRSDIFVPLYERGRIANRANGKLFISIHCNASKDRRATGSQTFFLSPARNKQAVAVAMLENSAIEFEEDKEQYQSLTDENYILLNMAQSNYIKESETLGAEVQNWFERKTELKNRGVDQAGFYVLYGANMPAVLVECGFISNKYEEKLLKSKKFRQTVAEVLFQSIVKFCEKKEKEF
jgi:N-acetylmuramoyl-L-alanine amidase